MTVDVTAQFEQYGCDNATIYPITEDTASAYTVGTGLVVPGLKQFNVTPDLTSKTLTGGEKNLATRAKLMGHKLSFQMAKADLPIFALLVGGTSTKTGTGGTEKTTYDINGNSQSGYFQFVVQILDGKGGDAKFYLMKCRCTALPITGNESDFATFTVEAECIFTEYPFDADGKLSRFIKSATKSSITALTSAS